jgi:hypothetical protein
MSPLKRTFWLGAGLIVLSNALALGGVYYNRSGEPDSVLRLSERELAVAYSRIIEDSDFSNRVLTLQFRMADGWVTADKLRSLGFSPGDHDTEYVNDGRALDGLVVLELSGPQYRAELAAAQASLAEAQQALTATPRDEATQEEVETAQESLGRLLSISTRLYVVDAGLDAASLRERYPDRSKYALARASLRFATRYSGSAEAPREYTLYPELTEFSVPNQWSAVFAGWQPYDRDAQDRSRVSVELAFGKRFEPWVLEAKRM